MLGSYKFQYDQCQMQLFTVMSQGCKKLFVVIQKSHSQGFYKLKFYHFLPKLIINHYLHQYQLKKMKAHCRYLR